MLASEPNRIKMCRRLHVIAAYPSISTRQTQDFVRGGRALLEQKKKKKRWHYGQRVQGAIVDDYRGLKCAKDE